MDPAYKDSKTEPQIPTTIQIVSEFFQNQNDEFMNILMKKLRKYDKIWEVLLCIGNLIQQLLQQNPQKIKVRKQKCMGSVHFEGDNIFIGQGTTIQHGAFIKGPCIIGKNCEIRKGGYIRGNAIIGDNCLIGNSSEIKNSILLGGCQIAHFNYIGDSILGYKSHFSAGAITSNLKLDSSQINIVLSQNSKSIKTNLIKIGVIAGDNTEIGCNAVLNPGSVISRNSVIYPHINFRGYLGSNKICKLIQNQVVVQRK